MLPELFASLALQQSVFFELILCDAGSHDQSPSIAQELARNVNFRVRIIAADKGRGKQMNSGAETANSNLLLFLHADSRFSDVDALATAVSYYRQKSAMATGVVAARFRLRFQRSSETPSAAYYYYEEKARLNRSDCIRGDQGFLISMDAFRQVGRFATSFHFLEDIRMADMIAKHGNWLLIPADIFTSARRFESEGLYERQALNAIIASCAELGWDRFFAELPSLYGIHHESKRLDLPRILQGINRLIAEQPVQWQQKFWQDTGRYVAANAWQLFFWLDVRRNFNTSKDAENSNRWLCRYQRYAATFFHSKIAGYIAMFLTRLWFNRERRRS